MNPYSIAESLLACVTCMGDRGAATNAATSGAVIFMLVVLGGVFFGVFRFIRFLSRCEREAIERSRQS